MPDSSSVGPTREELRKRLRAKTRRGGGGGGGGGGSASVPAGVIKNNLDMTSLMLSMGLDDPELLSELTSSGGNPKALLSKLTSSLGKMQQPELEPPSQPSQPTHAAASDDEEAPDLVTLE